VVLYVYSHFISDLFAAVMMKHFYVSWLVGCIYCVALVCFSQAEMFTAVVDLERILHAEYEVAKDLRNYVQNEQQRIDRLRRLNCIQY